MREFMSEYGLTILTISVSIIVMTLAFYLFANPQSPIAGVIESFIESIT